jgi:hypothetical protein
MLNNIGLPGLLLLSPLLLGIIVVPFWILLPKFRIPAPVALVSIIPIGGLILLWVMALRSQNEDKGLLK